MGKEIDIVIPYVNNNDPVWRNTFINYCTRTKYYKRVASMVGQRFDEIGLFEYLIKGIDKFMPWVNNIYLLVSNKEQVPSYIDKKRIKVVLHEQFIPYKYLPTFNSTTIEMFLDKIPNLAEHFIYINDDMFPIAALDPNDFFTESNKIKISFIKDVLQANPTQFKQVCYHQYKEICELLGYYVLPAESFQRPYHSFTPMIKSHCKEIRQLLDDKIKQVLAPFRTEYQYNQYIYPLYELFKGNTVESDIKFEYLELNNDLDKIISAIDHNQIVCINDSTCKKGIDIKSIKNKLKEKVE